MLPSQIHLTMSVIERDLTCLVLPSSLSSLTPGSELTSFTLVSGPRDSLLGF